MNDGGRGVRQSALGETADYVIIEQKTCQLSVVLLLGFGLTTRYCPPECLSES